MTTITNKQGFALAVELGLCVSVWSPLLECEAMRSVPRGARQAEPDLRITPQFDDNDEYETLTAEALTEDGRAFLALLADEIPPTVRTPYS